MVRGWGGTDCLMVFNVYGPCILARVPFFHSPVEFNIQYLSLFRSLLLNEDDRLS